MKYSPCTELHPNCTLLWRRERLAVFCGFFPSAAPLGLPKGAHVLSMMQATAMQMNLLDEINEAVKADRRAPYLCNIWPTLIFVRGVRAEETFWWVFGL